MTNDELGRNYGDGEVVYWEGEEGSTMYIIQRGRVRVSKITGEGDATIAILGPGDVFGEMALFEEQLRSTTVTTLENSQILSIDKEKFFRTITRDPSIAFNILKIMSDRLRMKDEEFARLRKRRLEVLRTGMDLSETCRVILEEAGDAVEADNGSVMIISEDRKSLEIVAAWGTDTPEKAQLSIGEGIVGHVLASGKAELINNVKLDNRFKPGSLPISSIICVPINSEGENFGVINLSHSSEERSFSQLDLRLVKTLSIYASVAVRNAISLSNMEQAIQIVDRGINELDEDDASPSGQPD
jgi:CRP-like cAMP-binding protein